MKVINFDYKNIPTLNDSFSLCLGYFDGVHIGHKSMIQKSINEGYKTAVLTFDYSPKFILGNLTKEYQLTTTEEKAKIFEELGVSYLFVLHFDLECSSLSYEQFKDLLKVINPSVIYCGSDYTFGKFGKGNPEYLSNFFKVNIVPFETVDSIKVSSRTIIQLISEGKIEKANQLLGYNYKISGVVVRGFSNGNKIGFPTANIKNESHISPLKGVYATYTYIDGIKYKSMVNVGTHPTIDESDEVIIESNIFDFNENIYGKTIEIEFIKFTRKETKFASLDELKDQLTNDEKSIRKIL